MLYCLIVLLLSPTTSALQPRNFRIPSVDFTQLSSAVNNVHNFKLLTTLQENGIVALQNVPNYSILRQEYLQTAITCAVQAQKQDVEFLLHRQLRDGTNRFTMSLESGHQLSETLDQSQQLLALCPEYVEIHAAFSAVVELAVANVGTALDATQKFHVVAEQGAVAMTARKLLEDSVHLDHFHAYEGAQGLQRLENDTEINVADMSLGLHTDNGLMIAMSAPEYFEELSNGELHRKDMQNKDAGLYIQTTSGEIVRPVLNSDELILMLGSGIDNWIETTPPLRSVLHGMRYPRSVSLAEGDEQGSRLLRSWFGKMILLEAHQVMDNTGLTFGQYANRTTRYLVEKKAEDYHTFAAIACPPQRHLAASDNSCSLKACMLKSSALDSDLTFPCQIICNHDSAEDTALCEKYCDCEASSSSATTCWMLCVENFSSEVCPGKQVCNTAATKDQLAMTCVDGTVPPSTFLDPTAPTPAGGSANSSSSTTSNLPGGSADPSSSTTPNPAGGSANPSSSTTSNPAGENANPSGSMTPASISGTAAVTPTTATFGPTLMDSNSILPVTNARTAASTTNVGNESTDATNTKDVSDSAAPDDDTSLTSTLEPLSSSSASSQSSATSLISVFSYVNSIASFVAIFLCIW
ncbi:unnamed protein product [Peronospora belbahrii]|uniref:Uncharacterized protein n=1 Tax=Peronospora belbahrii TaxID=622444 RepID=A0ABN8CTY2_9STRA|nr:unnamed protein product [Peronospora belbahrii]